MSSRSSSPILWLSAATPPAAWFAYQQGLGALVRSDCAVSGGPVGLGAGVAALAVCAGAAAIGRSFGKSGDGQTVGLIGALASWGAALFALAILFQMAAAAIIPPCAR